MKGNLMTKIEKPHALLLDFGGVVATTAKRPEWVENMTDELRKLFVDVGLPEGTVSAEEIAHDIRAGSIGAGHWKNAMSRPYAPREMTYEEFWGDYVAADWPAEARELVIEHAEELCRKLGHLRQTRTIREGMVELLERARAENVKVGIVSNSLSGQVHREFLVEQEISHLFDAEVYSDEVKLRKPNPEIITMTADLLGVDVAHCWYVGDNFDRDAVCGARAGVGLNVLIEARDTYEKPFEVRQQPDRLLTNGLELLELFLSTVDQ